MSNLPEDQFPEATNWSASGEAVSHQEQAALQQTAPVVAAAPEAMPEATETAIAQPSAAAGEQPMFQSWPQPEPPKPVRIPNFGHLAILSVLLLMGFSVAIVVFLIAAKVHLFGVSTMQQAGTDIHYILGTEAVIYLATLGFALFAFPPLWHKSLFAGLQWNGGTAIRLRWRLWGLAIVCFFLAWLNGEFMSSPTNTPIEKIFKTPGAAWFLFVFGVTFAPFFEETFFRGFLLPSLCTAYDWIVEKIRNAPAPPLGPNGHPQWSLAAMIVGSVATSIPFAAMHAEQTGYAIGPFLLLVGVSLVLCAVRLMTKSLASSILVHASYNFLLFSLMLIGTSGFRHLDKM